MEESKDISIIKYLKRDGIEKLNKLSNNERINIPSYIKLFKIADIINELEDSKEIAFDKTAKKFKLSSKTIRRIWKKRFDFKKKWEILFEL